MESDVIVLLVIFAALILVIVGAALYRAYRKEFSVYDFQRAILFRFGRKIQVLGPGRHQFWGKGYVMQTVDTRRTIQAVPNQEILTSDGLSLRISAVSTYAVEDVEKAILTVDSYLSAIHLTVQSALRSIVGNLTAEDLLAKRSTIGEELSEKCRPIFEGMGIKLGNVEVRDIAFPGELKKIFTQAILAKQEGLAALERARGETAALRHLANAAKMLENNPELMKLRILQSLSEAKGATVVLDTTDSKSVVVRG